MHCSLKKAFLSLLAILWNSVFSWMGKAMPPCSSTLAWKIPWTEEPGGLQSMGLLGVGHDWTTSLSIFTFMHWRRKWQPTPVFLPGESQGWGSLVAAVYGVAQSWTQLKRLSSSSSSSVGCTFGRIDAEAEDPVFWSLDAYSWLIGKVTDAGKDWGQEKKGAFEGEMADGIINAMGMNLGKLWEMVGNREAWSAAVHEVAKSRTWLFNWTTTR